MMTKEQLKKEVEKVPDQYIDLLYMIIKALEKQGSKPTEKTWLEFIDNTFGCMNDSPIQRGKQGILENREEMQ